MNIHRKCTLIVAAVQMSQPEYQVGEGDNVVEVCAQLTNLPADGLECEITVTIQPSNGIKAGKLYISKV